MCRPAPSISPFTTSTHSAYRTQPTRQSDSLKGSLTHRSALCVPVRPALEIICGDHRRASTGGNKSPLPHPPPRRMPILNLGITLPPPAWARARGRSQGRGDVPLRASRRTRRPGAAPALCQALLSGPPGLRSRPRLFASVFTVRAPSSPVAATGPSNSSRRAWAPPPRPDRPGRATRHRFIVRVTQGKSEKDARALCLAARIFSARRTRPILNMTVDFELVVVRRQRWRVKEEDADLDGGGEWMRRDVIWRLIGGGGGGSNCDEQGLDWLNELESAIRRRHHIASVRTSPMHRWPTL
ncbi:hypothetical protein DFH06DRAFT_1432649 [Mycena polygramma]|nr:hypothetical protein DFH06DRAFT_1432649 [Mycena polygramma]